jgi:hypothetical protein
MSQSLQGYRCRQTSSISSDPTVPTMSIFGLDDLRNAFPGSTLTFSTSQDKSYTYFWYQDIYPTMTFPGIVTQTPGASQYLDQFSNSVPACVNDLNTTCSSLFYASLKCWSESFPPGPQGCYCAALQANNCTSLCQSKAKDRNDYFEWTMGLCNSRNITTGDNNSTAANFTIHWPEYANRSATLYEDMFPWAWRLQPSNITALPLHNNSKATVLRSTNGTMLNLTATAGPTCSSSNNSKLVSFAVVNAVTALSTLLAHRGLADTVTAAYLGKPGSRGWPLAALLSTALNLIATAINARVVLRSPGFEGNMTAPSLSALFFFLLARPRFSWIASALVRVQQHRIPYLASGTSLLLSEVLQQVIGAAVLICVLAYGAERGYYGIGSLAYAPAGKWALTMYVGALVYLIGFAFLLVMVVDTVMQWSRLRGRQDRADDVGSESDHAQAVNAQTQQPLKAEDFLPPIAMDLGVPIGQAPTRLHALMPFGEAVTRMGLSDKIVKSIEAGWISMFLPFVAQWIFWVGFVQFAGDR